MLRSPLKLLGLLAGISMYAMAVQSAAAATVTFTGTGTGGGEALSASADFTTSAGQVMVVIKNLLSPSAITSVGQTVSDLSFTLSNSPGTLGTASASGQLANIGAGGTVTNVSGSPVRWVGQGPPPPGGTGTAPSISGNIVTLEAIGGGQPSQLLLPSGGNFTSGNASITGGQFNPFTVGSLTVLLALTGVTSATTITAATFSFGTGPDFFVPGTVSGVPLPGALPLFATGLAGLGLLRWKRKRKAQPAAA